MDVRRLGTAAIAVLVLCSTALVGVAGATHVGCGQVITQSTTLDSDVGPCPGDGIVIGASGITLDLGRHRVLGMGSATGILVSGHHRVRVMNGTVTGFSEGVRAVLSSEDTIEGLVVRDNRSTGLALTANFSNRVRLNVITGNGGSGIGTGGSYNNVIESNVVGQNAGPGVFIGPRSLNFLNCCNTLRQNSISNNGGDGVLLTTMANSTQIVGNSISNNGRNGVLVSVFSGDQCCDLIQSNVIMGNATNGVLIQGNRPLQAPPSSLSNRVLTNTAFANRVFDLADENPGCDNNTWAGNAFGTRNQPCIM